MGHPVEDLIHAEHLKPFFAEKEPEDDEETLDRDRSREEDDNARPPGEEEKAMSEWALGPIRTRLA